VEDAENIDVLVRLDEVSDTIVTVEQDADFPARERFIPVANLREIR
jgi:hypothetical protein